jgi:RND superfamily putative drug exporter
MTRWALSKPKHTLAIWGAVFGLLALAGIGVGNRLHRTNLLIPDTKAGRAEALQRSRFGDSSGVLILLRGPRSALDRQGPLLARNLDRQPHISVASPWTSGLGKSLRDGNHKALLLIRVKEPFEQVSGVAVPRIRSQLGREIQPPVVANMTGYPDIANAIHGDTVKAIERAELIAGPLLIIILLLVFRSPVAAAVPLAIGMTTVGASGGVLDLLNRLFDLDVVSFNLASMMGLALGVDYSLLLVSRFREELATGQEVRFAAQTAATTAGHTVRFAGLALVAAMLAALLVAPGTIMLSAVAGVLVATLLSVIAASTALPATLVVLGERINLWRFGHGSGERAGLAGAALAALRRPALAAGLVLVLMVALAAPAMAIETGPPDPRILPTSSPERRDFDAITQQLGDGWGAPYEITIAAKHGAVTTPRTLSEIQRFQNRIASSRSVQEVFGPGMIAQQTAPLARASEQLVKGRKQLGHSQEALGRLSHGLDRAARGTEQLRSGLATASSGAQQVASGSDRGQQGALQIQSGLAASQHGADLLQSGLSRSGPGLEKLARGAGKARSGVGRLRAGIRQIRNGAASGQPKLRKLRQALLTAESNVKALREPVGVANSNLSKALSSLDQMSPQSKNDPQYFQIYQAVDAAKAAISGTDPLTGQKVSSGYDGLDAALVATGDGAEQAAAAVARVEKRTNKLLRGVKKLSHGGGDLSQALDRLSAGAGRLRRGGSSAVAGAGRLSSGLSRLQTGAGSLASGVGRLQSGANDLSSGLQSGEARTGKLVSGVKRLHNGVVTFQARTAKSSKQLGNTGQLGKVLGSGYTTLAAVDTADGSTRSAASQAVNLDEGGTAARILVVEHGASDRAGDPLRKKLDADAATFARRTGTEVVVGGPAADLQDFDGAVSSSFPLMVALLCIVTFLVLIPLLRSLLLPLIAVALNVLTVAAALGVLTLLFSGSAPLGGPGFVDDIMRTSIFALVFALSIDYEVFLLARMREGYLRTGTTDGAIEYGLRNTAGVVTGAALIMTGVFVAFALSPIISMRELGLGLAVAVLLDATVVRLVLLPAAMRLAGDRIWWLPDWMKGLFREERRAPSGPSSPAELARVRSLAG